MRRAALLALALLAAAAPATAPNAAVSPERILLRTTAGDLVVALSAREAPEHARRFLALARAGVLDGTYFYRVQPGFVAQTAVAEDRRVPLTDAQKKLIRPIPAEISGLKHGRGVLSLAHEDDKPDSGTTSYSILLGAAPHLDGKFTVFGRVEAGERALQALERAPTTPDFRPRLRIEILTATVLEDGRYDPARLRGPEELQAALAAPPGTPAGFTIGLLGLIVALGLGLGLARGPWADRARPSMALAIVFVAAFGILVHQGAEPGRPGWAGLLLFAGLLALFKLMGRFERPSA